MKNKNPEGTLTGALCCFNAIGNSTYKLELNWSYYKSYIIFSRCNFNVCINRLVNNKCNLNL